MDWIEKVFHISPDGGTGLTELAFFLVFVLAIAVYTWSRRARRARKPQRPA